MACTMSRPLLAQFKPSGLLNTFQPRLINRRQASRMATASLADKKCVSCEDKPNDPQCTKLTDDAAKQMASDHLQGWEVVTTADNTLALRRTLKTKNFKSALSLCDQIGKIADEQRHHPDLHITNWNHMAIELSTHSVKGLTENDVIMASKIDAIDMSELLSKKQ